MSLVLVRVSPTPERGFIVGVTIHIGFWMTVGLIGLIVAAVKRSK